MNRTITPGHLRIGQIKLAPGHEWTDDAKTWRFVCLSRGAAYWLDTTRPRAVNEGELLIVGPGKKAVIRASQLGEVLLQAFSFTPDLLCGFFTLSERHFFETNGIHGPEEVQFLPSTHPLTQRFVALAARAGAGHELAVRVEVLGLAMGFFGDVAASMRLPNASAVSAEYRFHQIISQMPDLELINHTREQLARLCGCSTRHFNRIFHEHFGQSLRARQTELRLLKARQLLAGSSARVFQVAVDCGYRSLSLFNALFKRRFGMSPSELRRRMAKTKGNTTALLAIMVFLVALGLRGGVKSASECSSEENPKSGSIKLFGHLPYCRNLFAISSSSGFHIS